MSPNRSQSKREAPVAIISIAQQAKPNVMGQRAEALAQLNRLSTVVTTMLSLNRFSSTLIIHPVKSSGRAELPYPIITPKIGLHQLILRRVPQAEPSANLL